MLTLGQSGEGEIACLLEEGQATNPVIITTGYVGRPAHFKPAQCTALEELTWTPTSHHALGAAPPARCDVGKFENHPIGSPSPPLALRRSSRARANPGRRRPRVPFASGAHESGRHTALGIPCCKRSQTFGQKASERTMSPRGPLAAAAAWLTLAVLVVTFGQVLAKGKPAGGCSSREMMEGLGYCNGKGSGERLPQRMRLQRKLPLMGGRARKV